MMNTCVISFVSGDDLHRSEMRIILLGPRASGKSSSGNTILGTEEFSLERTAQCEKRQGDVAGRQVTVIDTPGWWIDDPLNDTSELIKQEIVLSASLCPPGPHGSSFMNEPFKGIVHVFYLHCMEYLTYNPFCPGTHFGVLYPIYKSLC